MYVWLTLIWACVRRLAHCNNACCLIVVLKPTCSASPVDLSGVVLVANS